MFVIRYTLLLSTALFIIGCTDPAVDIEAGDQTERVQADAAANNPLWETADFAHQASDLPMDEDITYGRLPNGLRYAVMENATPSRTATLLMRVDAGSLDETDATRGIAHFLEHMAFNGSENIPEGEMTKRLERLGLSFGADTNASTSFDQTIYQLELPETTDEMLEEALFIFRETAEKLNLDPDAIDRERGVILAEKRARNSPGYRAAIDGLRFSSPGADLVEKLPIGTVETIENVTPEDFRAFYSEQYRPEDTFIVLVGDRPAEQMVQMIDAAFSDWVSVGEGVADVKVTGITVDAPRYEAFFDPEITSRVTLSVISPPRPEARERDTAANRAAELPLYFAYAMLNRRYAKRVRTGEAVFTGAGAGTSNTFEAARTSSLSVSAEHDAIAPAFQQAERELRRALEHGFSQAELDEQVANIRKSYEVAVQTSPTRRTPNLARNILNAFANEQVMTSAASNLERFVSVIDNITVEDAETALRAAWVGLEERPQVYLQSDTVIEDAPQFLEDMLVESRTVDLPALEQTDAGEFAYADWGTPGEIVSRETIEDLGFTALRFENNVRLTLKQTPYETDVIRIRVRSGNGSAHFDLDNTAFPTQIGSIIPRSGLGAHDTDTLATLTAGRTVGVSLGFGQEAMTLSATTVPDDLELQFQLLAAQLTDPGFREDVIPNFQKQVRQVWSKFDSTPSGAAGIAIPAILTQGHPSSRHPDESEVVNVDLDAIKQWYDQNVRGGAIEIAVVGDFDEAATIDAVAATFGTLEARPDPVVDIPAEALDYSLTPGRMRPHRVGHSGEPDTALVRLYWPVPNHSSPKTDRELSILADALGLELTERLREQEGATYSPSAWVSLPEHKHDYGYIAASVEAAPNEVDRVTELIEAAAADLARDGLSADVFDRAMKPVLENLETSLENNNFWLSLADEAQSDPASLDRYRTRDLMFQNMTASDVSKQAEAVFDVSRAVRIHVLPEE
jgi:zinc protease